MSNLFFYTGGIVWSSTLILALLLFSVGIWIRFIAPLQRAFALFFFINKYPKFMIDKYQGKKDFGLLSKIFDEELNGWNCFNVSGHGYGYKFGYKINKFGLISF